MYIHMGGWSTKCTQSNRWGVGYKVIFCVRNFWMGLIPIILSSILSVHWCYSDKSKQHRLRSEEVQAEVGAIRRDM